MEADAIGALGLGEVSASQPADELVHVFVAPHPGRESRERRERQLRAGPIAEHVVIDPGGVGPVGLDGDEVEAAPFDEGLRDPRPHPVELARAVGGLAQQDEARVSDALEQGVDRARVDVVDRLRRLANQLRNGRVPAALAWGAQHAFFFFWPALLADQRDEADLAERLLAKVVGPDPGHPRQHLRGLVRAHRDDQASAGRELCEQRLRDLRPARRHRDGVEGRVLGPPERPVAVQHLHVAIAEPLQSLARLGRQRCPPLDGEDLLGDPAEHRRRVARAGSDFQHPFVPLEAQRFGRERDDVGLGDRLILPDGKRRVPVGELRQRGRHERLARARRGRRRARARPRCRGGRAGGPPFERAVHRRSWQTNTQDSDRRPGCVPGTQQSKLLVSSCGDSGTTRG